MTTKEIQIDHDHHIAPNQQRVADAAADLDGLPRPSAG